jgi:hypothetical protein
MISITIAIIIIATVFVIVISNIIVVTIISFSRFILNTRMCLSGRKFRGGTFPVCDSYLLWCLSPDICCFPFGPHSRLESSAEFFWGFNIVDFCNIYLFIYLFI